MYKNEYFDLYWFVVWGNNSINKTYNKLPIEKENKIVQKEIFQEHYHPISQRLLLDKLEKLGYEAPEIFCMPAYIGEFDPENHDWYAVIARKPR